MSDVSEQAKALDGAPFGHTSSSHSLLARIRQTHTEDEARAIAGRIEGES